MTIPAFLRASLLGLLSMQLAVSVQGQTAQQSRIAANADLGPQMQMTGNLPRWVTPAADAGAAPDGTAVNLTVMLARTPALQMAFEQRLVAQQNPASPYYHKWMTPQEIGTEFGPTLDDVAAVQGWLTSKGLTVASVSPARTSITVTGTAGVTGAAFSTSFHYYTLGGEKRLAAVAEPSIPAAFAGVVNGIVGMADVPLRPYNVVKPAVPMSVPSGGSGGAVKPLYTNSSTVHYVFPGDFNVIYDVNTIVNAGFTGTGVKVAIIGRSQITNSDVTELEGYAGQSARTPNVVLVPGSANPGLVAGDEDESTLDVGRVLTTATGAQADLVIAAAADGGGITPATEYNVNTLLDPVMTISYGACEPLAGVANVNFANNLFSQAAGEGISTFVSSGDSAAAGCATSFSTPTTTEYVAMGNYLCSSSYVTCMGGTEFADFTAPTNYWSATNSSTNVSALGYIPEGAWNEPTTVNNAGTTVFQVAASSGGPSAFIPKPTFQTALTLADSARDTPDLAFTTADHDGYFACLDYAVTPHTCATGYGVIFSGTSAAAPGMAAVAAILDQKLGASLGNINPLVYKIAGTTPTDFHDASPASSGVTSCTTATASMCNNSVASPTSVTGGLAGSPLLAGYDLVTGLGSLDVSAFITTASQTTLTPTSVAVTASPTTILAGHTAVFTATITTTGTPTGTMQFYNNGVAMGTPVLVTGTTVSTPATTFSTPGTFAITAVYSGDSNYAGATSPPLNFQVTLPATTTVVTAVPTTILAGRSAIFTATVAITSGVAATGTVQFYNNGVAMGTAVTIASGVASTPAITFPTAGTFQISATYSGDLNNQTSMGTLNFVVSPLPATTTTVTANPTSIVAGNTAVFTATVTSTTVGTFTGNVTFYSNGVEIGSSAVTLSGAKATSVAMLFPAATTYSITATYANDVNYATSTGTLSFVVAAASATGLTASASPSSLSVAPGASTGNTSTITVGTTAPYYGTVSLSCAVAFGGGTATYPPTCLFGSFASTTLTYAGTSSATSMLTVATTTPHLKAGTGAAANRSAPGFGAMAGISFAGVLLLVMPGRRRLRGARLLAVLLMAAGMIGMTGCGGSGSAAPQQTLVGTTPGAYTVTVTAMPQGGSAAATTVALTVQ